MDRHLGMAADRHLGMAVCDGQDNQMMDKHLFSFFTIEHKFHIDTGEMRRSRVNPDSVPH